MSERKDGRKARNCGHDRLRRGESSIRIAYLVNGSGSVNSDIQIVSRHGMLIE